MIPTALMGASFPLIVKAALGSRDDGGRASPTTAQQPAHRGADQKRPRRLGHTRPVVAPEQHRMPAAVTVPAHGKGGRRRVGQHSPDRLEIHQGLAASSYTK